MRGFLPAPSGLVRVGRAENNTSPKWLGRWRCAAACAPRYDRTPHTGCPNEELPRNCHDDIQTTPAPNSAKGLASHPEPDADLPELISPLILRRVTMRRAGWRSAGKASRS